MKYKENSVFEAASVILNEKLGYSASQSDLQDTAKAIVEMPGGKLEKFFIALSDSFMELGENENQVNAKTLASNLLKLSKLAKEIN